jgi:hypothetical protein
VFEAWPEQENYSGTDSTFHPLNHYFLADQKNQVITD